MPLEAGARLELAGPTMDAAFFTYTQRDFMLVFPLMLVVIVVVILVLFRTLRALIFPWPWCSDCLWVADGGLESEHHHPRNHLSLAARDRHRELRPCDVSLPDRPPRGDPGRARGPQGAARSCFFTAITTTAGMLSLTTSTLAPLRQFGVLGAIGAFAPSY